MGMIGGPFPPGGRPPGGTGGDPGGKPADETSTLNASRVENTVLVTANFHLDKAASNRMFTLLVQKVVHAKGEADMTGGRSRIHDLAAALHAYAQKNQQFPRGTADRRSTAERQGLPFRPDQRVSWMAELLPYLGQGEFAGLKRHIDDQQSWRVPSSKDDKDDMDGKNNRFVAQTLIPYFLASNSPSASWWVHYPSVDFPVASTHFVGIAGIGLDAANYSATDPAVAKKLGVFGYDRATKLVDVKDGLPNTIVLLQVPTDIKTCWLAGGGSTIRGVPEIDPIQSFVCAEFKGKQGTFAVMGDGKVRFLSKDMNPEVFKGMCTINGGEEVGDLEQIAPVVPGGEAVLKPGLPGDLVAPPVDKTPIPPVDGPKPIEGPKPPTVGTKPIESPKPIEGAKPPVEAPKPPKEGSNPSLDATVVTKAFEDDHDAAHKEYGNKKLTVTGVVSEVENLSNEDNTVMVILKGHNAKYVVRCSKFGDIKDVLAKVKVGQSVRVEGDCLGEFRGDVLLSGCKLMESPKE